MRFCGRCWWWGCCWLARTWVVLTVWEERKVISVPFPSPLPLPSPSSSTPVNVRTNIVAEVPGLDVGPLVSVMVSLGDTARLPCRHPKPENDTVSLVLWYLNHTSRPFLSYDARAEMDSMNTSGGKSRSGRDRDAHKMWLEDAGTSLVVQNVRTEDTAEYRCRVHFRLSPTWTQRLLLSISGSVSRLIVLNALGERVTGGKVGPFEEKSTLNLQCKADHGSSKVESLIWLHDGKEIDKTWEERSPEVSINKLTVRNLQHRHHRSQLTCRLTALDPMLSQVTANITDVTTTVMMFRVPEVNLSIEENFEVSSSTRRKGGGREGGRSESTLRKGGTGKQVGDEEQDIGSASGGYEVNEGSSVTFLCSISADPPAYNVTWLHKGRVIGVGGRRWQRDNISLVIKPVTRKDGGLYTCLASNREGDGHSNAVLLKIAHIPQCRDPKEKNLVVATHTSLNLSCDMDGVPESLTFTWSMVDVQQEKNKDKGIKDVRGGIITGDSPPPQLPELIDLTPDHTSGEGLTFTPSPGSSLTGIYRDEKNNDFQGSFLKHREDPSNPTRSILTVTPTSPVQIFCYARNKLGRTRIPCSYKLALVDPPEPLRFCNITAVDVTRLEVRCDDPSPAKDVTDSEIVPQIKYSPGISFVRSSEARTTALLQVYSGENLIANVSGDRPEFLVDNLPHSSSLKLVLYAVSPHARSRPVYMYAQTLPKLSIHISDSPPFDPDIDDFYSDVSYWDDFEGTMGGVVGGVIGSACIMLIILTGVFIVIWCRQRHQPHVREDTPSSVHSGVSTPAGSLSHLGSHSHLDNRHPVYCLNRGSESHESPWLETSITPLVAPATPMTPSQLQTVEAMILEDAPAGDVN